MSTEFRDGYSMEVGEGGAGPVRAWLRVAPFAGTEVRLSLFLEGETVDDFVSSLGSFVELVISRLEALVGEPNKPLMDVFWHKVMVDPEPWIHEKSHSPHWSAAQEGGSEATHGSDSAVGIPF